MQQDYLICDESGKTQLMDELCRRGGLHAFSYLYRWGNFKTWKTEYQLRKALKQLIACGLIIENFKGHNRYGYMRYGASMIAKELFTENRLNEEIEKCRQ
jgi:hypothetical protein